MSFTTSILFFHHLMMLHSGGNLVTTTIYKILEHNHPHLPTAQSCSPPPPLPLPLALVLSYPALDFNFTSWMTPSNLRVLRAEHEKSTTSLSSLLSQQKDHFAKKSPLSVVEDVRERRHQRQRSWAGRLLSASNVVGPLSPVTKKGGVIWGGGDEEGKSKKSLNRSRSGSNGAVERSPVAPRDAPSVASVVGGTMDSGNGSVITSPTGTSTPTPIGTPTPRQMTSKGPTSFRARLLSRVNEVNDLAIDTGVIAGNSPPPAGTSSGVVHGYSNGSRPNMLSFLSSSQNHPQQQQQQSGANGGEVFSSDGEDDNRHYHHHSPSRKSKSPPEEADDEEGNSSDDDDVYGRYSRMEDKDKPLSARVLYSDGENGPDGRETNEGGREVKGKKVPIGTRLTMTSRTAFFTDRIISPSMVSTTAFVCKEGRFVDN